MRNVMSSVIIGMFMLLSGVAMANNLEKRVETLEKEVKELKGKLKSSDKAEGYINARAVGYFPKSDCDNIKPVDYSDIYGYEFVIRKVIQCRDETYLLVKKINSEKIDLFNSKDVILYDK